MKIKTTEDPNQVNKEEKNWEKKKNYTEYTPTLKHAHISTKSKSPYSMSFNPLSIYVRKTTGRQDLFLFHSQKCEVWHLGRSHVNTLSILQKWLKVAARQANNRGTETRTSETQYRQTEIVAPAMKLCSSRLSSLLGTNAIFSVFVRSNIRYDIKR